MHTNLDDEFGLQNDKVENGEWVELKAGIAVLVRSVRSNLAKKVRAAAARPYARLLQAQQWQHTPEQIDKMDIETIIGALLVDWRGVIDADTKQPVAYTPQLGRQMVTQHALLREQILLAAGMDETFRKELAEEIAKNS